MSTTSDVALMESERLNKLGIPFNFIHVTDDIPIVIVDETTIKNIVMSRRSGQGIPGNFIAQSNGQWSATIIDAEGKCQYKTHLTESKAHRMALGIRIGKTPYHTRYVGQVPKRTPKKRTYKHRHS